MRLLQSFLFIAGHPEAVALDCSATGVCIGHNRRMPRTPAVFEAMKKWRLGYEAPDNHSEEWVKNYKAAGEHISAVKKKVTGYLKEKRILLSSYVEVKTFYGDRLHICGGGMVDEGVDKF